MVIALHISVDWIHNSLDLRHRWLWYTLYFALQGLLAFTISLVLRSYQALGYSLIVGSIGIISLYLSLMGEAVVWLRRMPFLALGVVVCCLLLLGLSLGTNLQVKWGSTLLWLYNLGILFLVPLTPFVVGYALTSARKRDRTLLGELEVAHTQLAAYATQVEDLTRSTERQRLARELHDTLAQGLTGVILLLEATHSRLLHKRYERAQESVQEALTCARSALTTARYAINDLRANAAALQSPAQVIQDEIRRFTTATAIPCSAELPSLTALAPGLAETIVRGVTEALTNVARHAQAQHVWVRLIGSPEEWLLEIQDDGVGFDPEAVAHAPGHYGLLGLRERARLTGGQLTICSQPGAGATLQIHMPRSEQTP
jgi:NarL family two-component system sensor histidine kinase YdfH